MMKNGYMASICWGCGNAYPSKCGWIKELKPVWKKAEDKRIKEFGQITELKIITECDHFIPDSDETRLKILDCRKCSSNLRSSGILRGGRA